MKLRVNGRAVYDEPAHRPLARGQPPHLDAPRTSLRAVRAARGSPCGCELGEDDALYGGDDHGDINPFGHRRDVLVSYPLGTLIQRRTTRGGNTYGGRLGDGDEAEITYRLETITPELIKGPPPPPPPPGPKPDLIITDFNLGSVTVKNQGPGPAGPFRVTMDDTISARHESFAGLAAGASETRTIDPRLGCHGWTAFVDDLNQVDETDETNNTRPVGDVHLLSWRSHRTAPGDEFSGQPRSHTP